MYQSFYSRFMNANPGVQHYACHSHYYWPDVTRDAMLEYWDDSAKWVDDKWQHFFNGVVPEVQAYISKALGTNCPQQIVFAPNTHELLYRILSCLHDQNTITVVTTDSEFHSFHRQSARLGETEKYQFHRVPVLPYPDFGARMVAEITLRRPQLVFLSQVFFNSGYVVSDLSSIIDASRAVGAQIVVDGYHGFMAMPQNWRPWQDDVFFLAGGYKYAQAGEGACFAHVPVNCTLRPQYTGWFAEFGALDKPRANEVSYATNGMRFAGSTMDFSALYRMRAVFQLFEKHSIDVADIHQHVKQVQQAFLQKLDEQEHALLNRQNLVVDELDQCGHFLTFELNNAKQTAALADALASHGIKTDFRGSRLRFGFSLYHDEKTINLGCLKQL